MVRHLYLHIPFCLRPCPYCGFYKEQWDGGKTAAFIEAVLVEAGREAEGLRPRTVFIGGGTPTSLSTEELERLVRGLRDRLDLSTVEEWTIEMNPATVEEEKARRLLGLGVDRFSMGVQAWQPELLRALGRVHTAEQAAESFRILRQSGCNNINLDLIFGIPGQTREQWKESLERTVALEPDHISAYCLTFEEDTPFFASLQSGRYEADEELEAELFAQAREFLGGWGFEGYEVSNFALSGRRCLHNLAYWRGRDYLGLGPGAFSTVHARRRRNVRDVSLYIQTTLEGRTLTDFEEPLDPTTRRNEFVAFGLRSSDGVPARLLPEIELRRLADEGLAEIRDGRCRLTGRGLLVADSIAAQFLV